MAFSRTHFIRHRPWLYHYTNPSNLESLVRRREMLSARVWVLEANQFRQQVPDVDAFLGTARGEQFPLEIGENSIVMLNDQIPLRNREKFASLRGTYEDYIRCLNNKIFFWAGDANRPITKRGLAHTFAERYAHYGCLRIPTEDVWSETESPLRFCTCNSGAPQARDRIERGPHIFKAHDDDCIRLKKVSETVVENRLVLPPTVEWQYPLHSQWRAL